MSTRSCIARIKGDGFEGVYHHWDGYPKGLGATLWELHRKRTLGELPDMLRTLIDQHPAGWSSINGADWSQEPGFNEANEPEQRKRPQCYCHGDRNEEAQPVTHADDMGLEYAYVFDEKDGRMVVCERVYENGEHNTGLFGTVGPNLGHWAIRAVLPLDGPEPDWKSL